MASDEANENSENQITDPRTKQYLEELLSEKHGMSTAGNPHASRLLDQEVSKTRQSGFAARDFRYVDIFREKPIKVVTKVIIPVREYPKFNFVGKLLGPKGNTLRRLQEETCCKMVILGRGSMKDKVKEEELRSGLDPKFAHLSDDLHVEVSALAPPSEAHARMSFALKELRRYLVPDSNDEISHEQLQEMESYMTDNPEVIPKPYFRGKNSHQHQPHHQPHQPHHQHQRPPQSSSKAKVMSILEKARTSMESVNQRAPSTHYQKHYTSHGHGHAHARSSGGYDGYSENYDSHAHAPHYEDKSDWGGGLKMQGNSRFVSRSSPYNRSHGRISPLMGTSSMPPN